MTESEFMEKAVKAGHKAADMLNEIDAEFNEGIFILWSSVHISCLAHEIFDKKEERK